MTPGINAAKKAGVTHKIHEYDHDPANDHYGDEAVEKTGADPLQVFKTLVVTVDDKQMVVAVIPVAGMLSMKQVARAAGGKKAAMSDPHDVQRSTGYVLGGVSPLGQKKRLKTFIDSSAQAFDTIYVSAGRRGLEIELSPADLATLTAAQFAPLQQV
jgi:Cys-tRNA(Pro)/Cys-tRNA(Cys) deacylase